MMAVCDFLLKTRYTSSSSRHPAEQDEIFLELGKLLLAGLQIAHHFNKGLVLLVYDPELLVEGMFYCILLHKGMIV